MDLEDRFSGKILDITIEVSKKWGEIQVISAKKGKTMPVIDSLIAATGLVYDLTVVTRNTTDMENSGVLLLNPWKSSSIKK